jgi:hypothetical protein
MIIHMDLLYDPFYKMYFIAHHSTSWHKNLCLQFLSKVMNPDLTTTSPNTVSLLSIHPCDSK